MMIEEIDYRPMVSFLFLLGGLRVVVIASIIILMAMHISQSPRSTREARSNLHKGGSVELRITEIRRDMGVCANLNYSGSKLETWTRMCRVERNAQVCLPRITTEQAI